MSDFPPRWHAEVSSLAGLAQMLDVGELHLPDLELKIPANRTRWFSLLYSKRSRPLCQTSLWRTDAGLKLPGQLHPPRCAEQPPYCRRRYAASDRHLHLSRLPAWLTAQGFNPLHPGFIRRFSLHILPPDWCAYSTLWNSGQQSQKA
jgi:hypothetical protein